MNAIDRQRCIDPAQSRDMEWLAANGRGGYALGTVGGFLTRRYHGLLAAAPESPAERYVLLAKLEITAVVAGRSYELSANDYPGTVHPQGYRNLESFAVLPTPTWRWRLESCELQQRIWMQPGVDRVFVELRGVSGFEPLELRVRPLCAGRHYHALLARESRAEPTVTGEPGGCCVTWPDGTPSLHLASDAAFEPGPDWYYNVLLAEETRRGYDDRQDLFCPGEFRATLRPGAGLLLAAATEPLDAARVAALAQQCDPALAEESATAARPTGRNISIPPVPRGEKGGVVSSASDHNTISGTATSVLPQKKDNRRADSERSAARAEPRRLPYDRDRLLRPLEHAAAQFLVSRSDGRSTVIAGYPWFGDWGRDTFISLPGLCLVTGRFEQARDILASFAHFVDRGMVPNRFPDRDRAGDAVAEYNSVDASLWYVQALGRYYDYTHDDRTLRQLYPVLREILRHYERGTRYAIHAADDGLLACGEPGVQLTWMDAKIGDWVVTPRIGKPVEINALWHEALRVGAEWAGRIDQPEDAAGWSRLAERCAESFDRRFWNPVGDCLHDVVDCDHRPGTADDALRPNQLLAISLKHPVLAEKKWRRVVDTVREQLLTPMGLRTLAADHPCYRGAYQGDQPARDAAYHQGTVWPWLLGPMISAFVRAHAAAPDARIMARSFLYGLETHLEQAGIGGVSEVADGEEPHAPGGCPWQAWSVAEPLRALMEDVLEVGS